MRLVMLVLAVLIALAGCSSTSSAPLLTDAERCARFSGTWSAGACRSGP